VLDGVYVRKAGSAELHFESLPAPSLEEVQDVARRTAERVETLLERTGRFSDVERAADEALDPLSADQPVLAGPSAFRDARQQTVKSHRCGEFQRICSASEHAIHEPY
jgi:hypothetical protein